MSIGPVDVILFKSYRGAARLKKNFIRWKRDGRARGRVACGGNVRIGGEKSVRG